MKFSHIVASSLTALGMFAFVACDDGNSAGQDEKSSSSSAPQSSAADGEYDCSVKNGFVVVAPDGSESFKVGDTISVVFGTDVEDASYIIKYRENDDVDGWKLTEGSIPGSKVVADGKTCNIIDVVLNPDDVDPSDEALIVVKGYNKSGIGKSKPFKVEE